MLSFSRLPRAGLSARLLFFSPFFVPVLSFAFLCLPCFFSFCFLCLAFVFLASSPLLVGRFLFFRVVGMLGLLLPFPGLGLRLAPCVCLCVGASARSMCCVPFWCVISLCWGFGLPRVFFSCSVCVFGGLGLWLARRVLPCSVVCFLCVGASARRVHVVLGICPPVSRQLLPAGVVGVGVLLGAVRGHGFPVWCGWVRL